MTINVLLITGCERYFIASQLSRCVCWYVIVDDPSLKLSRRTHNTSNTSTERGDRVDAGIRAILVQPGPHRTAPLELDQHITSRSAIVLYVPTPQLTKY